MLMLEQRDGEMLRWSLDEQGRGGEERGGFWMRGKTSSKEHKKSTFWGSRDLDDGESPSWALTGQGIQCSAPRLFVPRMFQAGASAELRFFSLVCR